MSDERSQNESCIIGELGSGSVDPTEVKRSGQILIQSQPTPPNLALGERFMQQPGRCLPPSGFGKVMMRGAMAQRLILCMINYGLEDR